MTDGLTFQGIPLNRATTLVGYGDSSWANAEGHNGRQSARSPRVTRSTLASEANSMDQCVDRMVYANHFLSEVLFGGQQPGAHLGQLHCMMQ